MKVVIEKVSLGDFDRKKSGLDFPAICRTIGELKVGESFCIQSTNTSHRHNVSGAAAYIGHAMGRKFVTKKENCKLRVGRIA